jgi:hypothetical protein
MKVNPDANENNTQAKEVVQEFTYTKDLQHTDPPKPHIPYPNKILDPVKKQQYVRQYAEQMHTSSAHSEEREYNPPNI